MQTDLNAFLWRDGDFTPELAVDIKSGVYRPDTSIPPSCGCWVRPIEDVYLPEWFGVKADGETDDTDGLQAALDVISYVGGGKLVIKKTPVISRPLVYSPSRAIGSSIVGSDLLFARLPVLEIVGQGDCQIIASAPMATMFKVTYGETSPAPNQCQIENVGFNGRGLASFGIFSEWPLGTSIKRCRIFDVDTGVRIYGRGGAHIADNLIRAKTGVSITRGGDSVIERNHIFLKGPAGSTRTAVYFGAWSGNSRATDNTIQAETTDNVDHANTRGVWMDGWSKDIIGSNIAKGVRDITIKGNEFHGIQTCVVADADTQDLNVGVCTVKVIDNHVMQGWWGNTQLIYARNAVSLTIDNNTFNVVGNGSVGRSAVQIEHCKTVDVKENKISNVQDINAILVTGWCTDVRIEENQFVDAVLSPDAVIYVGDATNIKIRRNRFKQSYVHTPLCVTEAGASGAENDFSENDIDTTFATPYWTANPNTVAQRIETSMWYPTDASRGAWRKGDKVYLMTPTPGGSVGYVCTTGGAPGVWKGFGTTAP